MNSAVVIQGQRIVEVGTAADVHIPTGSVRIQATGKTVMPGLIDMHVHLNKGDDLHLFIAAGVTTVRDVGKFTDQPVWMDHTDKQKEAALIKLMIERGTYVVPTFAVMPMQFPEAVPVPDDPALPYVSARLRGFWTAVDRIPGAGGTWRGVRDPDPRQRESGVANR